MHRTRVCVLGSSYENSLSPMKNWDDVDCTPAHFFTDPNYTFESVKIRKDHAYSQIRDLVLSQKFDVFLNLCDGGRDEDRAGVEVVQVLEEFNVPYTGVNVKYFEPTKIEMKLVAFAEGIKFPNYVHAYTIDDIKRASENLRFPLIVKHPSGYSSISMSKASKCIAKEQLMGEAEIFIRQFGSVLIEEFIEGREATILAYETGASDEILAFDPIEVSFPPNEDFKHFDMKFIDFEGMQWQTFKEEDAELAQKCIEIGKKAFKSMLGGFGYGRSDLRIDHSGEVYFLEVNPNCGIFYPKDAYGSADFILHQEPGRAEQFTKNIIDAALKRHAAKQENAPSFRVSYDKECGFMLQANRSIEEGELIFSYEGTPHNLISKNFVEKNWSENDKELFARYAWPLSDNWFVIWSDDPKDWKPINHSCDPNTWFIENHSLDVIARRNIACGEQITIDYATFCAGNYMIGFDCGCQSSLCRKHITGQDYKNIKELQERYKTRVTDFVFSYAHK